ncbi:oxidoreductase [Variovorax dokdonensis]|uniref:Oxidoreductase n=1 Tax=Variovorax dokdonensis TaxID=344883 RepID=A0ABT7NCJ5_9BURK|nr:oxidoreductase [Variovorax dokdonensis]MDM0045676.1 oxidoreductase [Variovorax dokdonensis]
MSIQDAAQAENVAVALVGYGFAGQVFHARVLACVPGLRLAVVVSSQPDKVAADWPDVPVSPDLGAALAAHPEVQLVVVATPNAAHFPIARAALEAGRHVVVDKPFTLDAGEARQLVALAERSGKIVSVYQNRRFDADFLTLRELLAQRRVGRPVYFESHFDRYRSEVRIRWREQNVPGAGLWVDLGAHLLDQALQLFGVPDTLQLDSAILRDSAEVEDYFHAVLRYERGAHSPLRVVLHATTLAAHPAPRYLLHGTHGSYVKEGVDPQEDALRAGALPGSEGWGIDPLAGHLVAPDAAAGTSTVEVPNLAGDYSRYYAMMRDAILGRGAPPVSADEAVQLMELLDLGRRSAIEGRALPTS